MPTTYMHSPMPIIIGVPRSGTTLLRLMLDAHTQLAVAHETDFIPLTAMLRSGLRRAFYERACQSVRLGSLSAGERAAFFHIVTTSRTWSSQKLLADDFRQALDQVEPFDRAEGLRAFYRLYAARFGKPRYGDKTPFYSAHLRLIKDTLPEAHIIHIIRDGRDVALSIKNLWFAPGKDLGTIAADWCRRIRTARHQSRDCPHYIEVRYEELVADSDSVLRRICDYISLPFETSMMDYHLGASARLDDLGSSDTPKDAHLSIHRLTEQPPQPSRTFRWKREMSQQEQQQFARVAGEMLEELGYEI